MLFKISNSIFYTQKAAYFLFKDSSSPVKASNFNPLNPDLLMLYRRPNPINISLGCTADHHAVPPLNIRPVESGIIHIFQTIEKLIPLTTTSQSGPDQPPLY